MSHSHEKPSNLQELRDSGWTSKSVKQEMRDNFLKALAAGDELRAFIDRRLDQRLNLVELRLVDDRADMRAHLGRVADGHRDLQRQREEVADPEPPAAVAREQHHQQPQLSG